MNTAASNRIVVVLGQGSPELDAVLRALGLAPLDDDSGDATLWLPAERAVREAPAEPATERARGAPVLLTTAQVATTLGVGRSMVYEMIGRGDLQVVHLGRAVRVTASSLEELLRRLQGLPAGQPKRSVGRVTLRSVGPSGTSQRRAASIRTAR
jgi:excisionase family DNA binding protein